MGNQCCSCLTGTTTDGRTVSDFESSNAFQGQGQRLGGSGDRAPAVARRQPQRSADQAPPRAPTAQTAPERAATRNADDRAAAAAAAAERRLQQEMQGLSAEKAAALKERRVKDGLIGKIQHYYQQAGQEEPFGLQACTVDALRKQLEYAQGLGGRAVERS